MTVRCELQRARSVLYSYLVTLILYAVLIAIQGSRLADEGLILFIIPVTLAAYLLERKIYLALALVHIVMAAGVLSVVEEHRTNPLEALVALTTSAVSTLLLSELLYRLATARRHNLALLAENSARYRTIVENTSDLIIHTDLTGRCLYLSPAVTPLLALTPQEVIGQPISQIMTPACASHFQVMLIPQIGQLTDCPFPFELELCHRDGHVIIAEMMTSILADARGRPSEIIGVARDVTERRQAEKRQLFMQYTIEHLPDPVLWVDPSGRVIDVNETACRFYGYTRDEILQLSVSDLDARISPEQWPGQWQQLRTQRHGIFESERRQRQGRPLPIEVSYNYVTYGGQEYVCCFIRDIAERKQAEDRLRLIQFSMDHSADGIFWNDAQGRIVEVNDTACRLLEYTRDELLTMTIFDIDPACSWELLENHNFFKYPEKGSFRLDTVHRTRGGQLRPVEIIINPVTFAGQTLACSFVRDISERKRLEEERQRFEAQMHHTQKLKSLGIVAGGIAHDFNNLLTVIIGNAELAATQLSPQLSPTTPAQHHIEEIQRCAGRAADLCRQMLAYSGKGRFIIEPVNINALAQEIASMLEVSIPRRVRFQYELAEALPPIQADSAQIVQVLINLITNAAEAIPADRPGTITLRTGQRHCDRAALARTVLDEKLPEGPYLWLEVADSGIGMNGETVQKMFDPFFTTKFTGRGLGLAGVHGIVRGHRGTIEVRSQPGQGTSITILLPLIPPPAMAATPATAATPAMAAPAPLPAAEWILVVDDEEPIRTVAGEMIEAMGYQVVTVESGEQAIAFVREHPERVQAVLLDYTMPKLNGEQTFQALRRLDPRLPIIIASGYHEREIADRFIDHGLAGFIQKPFTMEQLHQAVQQALRPGAAEKA